MTGLTMLAHPYECRKEATRNLSRFPRRLPISTTRFGMKKKVLAIHGHSQCAHTFRSKLSTIEKACQDAIEFVYIDAPHALLAVDMPGAIQSDGGSNSSSAITIGGQPARAWWRFLYTMRDVPTALESFEYIGRVLETQGPFDGILGFSQGASFAALIAAHLENREMEGNLLKDVKHPPLQFAVLFSGFYTPNKAIHLPNNIRTPSLHIFGMHDIMVAPENMARLLTYFESPRVEIHQGGHFIPRTLNWRHFLAEYLSSTGDHQAMAVPGEIETGSPTLPACREELEIVRRTIKGLDGSMRPLVGIAAEL